MTGPLVAKYRAAHPGARAALDVCRFFEDHPNQWFTKDEIKGRLGCSDRVIHQRVPDVLNEAATVIEIDHSQREFRYRYRTSEAGRS